MSRTPEYRALVDIKSRCLNQNNKSYHRYGGRGIKVCDRWLESFQSFYDDMGDRPSRKHSIDRIDNNGDYDPSNCRWATRCQQQNNISTNVMLTIYDITLSASQWAKVLEVNVDRIIKRKLSRRWIDDYEILLTPRSSTNQHKPAVKQLRH